MCGIAGRWLKHPHATPLSAALAQLAHRGPDDRGTWAEPGGPELAHTRLAIVDLSPAGRQPMTSSDGRVVLVYNGELYNTSELSQRLVQRGHVFRGHSDTEVLLALLREQGAEVLPRLDGMFAFAAYDTAQRELLVARDALGIKPLYFHASELGFAFASELGALLELAPIPREVDALALYRHLSFLWCPGSRTALAGVARLAPGELLRVRDGRVIERRTWAAPAFGPAHLSDGARGGQATPAVLAGALRRAVQRQLVADVPVGAFLSGGLDSSAVVAFARETQPELDCFTIAADGGLDAGEESDLPYARRMARALGVRLHEVPVDARRMAADLERLVLHLGEPVADPAALNVLYIAERARALGVKVLLSGVGGDDLFAGYRRHRALALERAWGWLPEAGRRALKHGTASLARGLATELPAWLAEGSAGPTSAIRDSMARAQALGRRLARAFAFADQSADERLIGYFTWGDAERSSALFAPRARAALSTAARDAPFAQHLAALPAGLDPLARMLALEQRFFLGDHNLPYADKMSMAASVEVRVPFLDPELVALANGLPSAEKLRGRHGKWALRRALAPHLPAEVLRRPKTGFGAPLRRWLRGDLRGWVDDLLSPARLAARGLFEPSAVRALIDADRRGALDAAYPILGLCCVELWCRHFIDRVDRGVADLPGPARVSP
jgi:asparagine synthase (glutamine-hydrolysing)